MDTLIEEGNPFFIERAEFNSREAITALVRAAGKAKE